MNAPDRRMLRRALALARRGEGTTRPNPPVGAVVFRDGEILSEGFHRVAGGRHAEAAALAALPEGTARGAELAVSLEPCSTAGRQPPCTEAVLRAGIRRVVIGARDPNPRNASGGIAALRAAGVEVEEADGEEKAAAKELLRPFASVWRRGRPWVRLKLAMTLDGRIAAADGTSRWITGPEARRDVQSWRRASDAILVGAGTVREDDPSLLPRPARGRAPWRVVLAGKNPLPADAKLFTDDARDRTLVLDGSDLPGALRALTEKHGVLTVLCEGGGETAGALLAAGLADELVLYYAPKWLGGPRGAVGSAVFPLADAGMQGFRWAGKPKRFGNDWRVRLVREASVSETDGTD